MLSCTKRLLGVAFTLVTLGVGVVLWSGCGGGGAGIVPVTGEVTASDGIQTFEPTPAEVAAINTAATTAVLAPGVDVGELTAPFDITIDGQTVTVVIPVTADMQAAAAAGTLDITVVITSLQVSQTRAAAPLTFNVGGPTIATLTYTNADGSTNSFIVNVTPAGGITPAIALVPSPKPIKIVVTNLRFSSLGSNKFLDVASLTVNFSVKTGAKNNSIPQTYDLTLPPNGGNVSTSRGSVTYWPAMVGRPVSLDVNTTGVDYSRTVNATSVGVGTARRAFAQFLPGTGTHVLGTNVTVTLTGLLP